MKMPAPVWSMTYSADRRRSRHRCACGCNTIVQPGDTVLMARVGKATRVVKAAPGHADRRHGGYTAAERLEAWGMEHLAACGWAEARRWIDTAPICKP